MANRGQISPYAAVVDEANGSVSPFSWSRGYEAFFIFSLMPDKIS
jgi:hypothetical protein